MPRKYIKKNKPKTYNNHDLMLAIDSVTHGYSIREAAVKYHIPYTTLNSHINNEFLHDKVGRPTKFSEEEENCLEQAAIVLQVIWFILIYQSCFLFFKRAGVYHCRSKNFLILLKNAPYR